MDKVHFKILTTLDRCQKTMTSGQIARQLSDHGIELPERTIRYHLKVLDQKGYTENHNKRGRKISRAGKTELTHGFACKRVGFIINKINNLSLLTDFNPETLTGKVILNVICVPEAQAPKALLAMSAVLDSPYSFSSRILVKKNGRAFGGLTVPPGMVGIGTVCSMTLNGILLKAGIPIESKYGGIVEIDKHLPQTFSAFIGYEKSSVSPLEVFLKSGMTDVGRTLAQGTGRVLASLREVPSTCLQEVKKQCRRLNDNGLGGRIFFGPSPQACLNIPLSPGRAGLVLLGNLNPAAVLAEEGIPAVSYSMETLCEYADLVPVKAYDGYFHTEPLRSAVG